VLGCAHTPPAAVSPRFSPVLLSPGVQPLTTRPLSIALPLSLAPSLPPAQAFCYFGKRAMAGAKPFGLQRTLVAWNAGLSLFSLVGFLRTAPHLLNTIAQDGFYASVSRRHWGRAEGG
jgi:hypothetical protein